MWLFRKTAAQVRKTAPQVAAVNNINKNVIFKNCAPCFACITKINNTQVDYVEDIDILLPLYNLKGYSNPYSKTSGSNRDEPPTNNGNIIDFPAYNNNSNSIKFKQQITG